MTKTVSFSRNAVNIFFHILTRCNLNCRHCYINPDQHGNNLLPLETIEKWLETFADKSRETNVIFLGGEPTLHPDLPGAVKKAKALGYKSITIDTNGFLFHDILEKIRPDEVDYISFSLDGATQATNDMIRGAGCYDACTKGIRNAVAAGFNASLIYTVSRDNLHELEKMPALLKDLGISRFFIQVIGIRGNPALTQAKDFQILPDEWLGLIPSIGSRVADSGITVVYPKVYLKPGERFECAARVAENYFIFPNGRVYQCPLCEDYPIHSMMFKDNRLVKTDRINENDLFQLDIPEGCVMNKLIQPGNIIYNDDGRPKYKIACCLLKEKITA